MTMRLKLFLSFLLIILVAVAGVAWIVQQGAAREVRTFMFGGGAGMLSEMQATLQEYYATNGSWAGVETVLTSTQTHGRGMGQGQGGMMNQRFWVADTQGEVIADSSGTAIGTKLTNSQLDAATILEANGSTVGYLLAMNGLGYTQGDETQLLTRLNQAALIAGLVAGGLALLLAALLAMQLLRPVRALTRAAHGMAQGDLSQRVAVRGKDEIAELGHTFNQMAGSLQQAEEARRAMTADIAHELRTPLAVQRANLEALQDGIYPLTAENLQPVLEQNRMLTRLVDDLRTLAMADAGQLTLERTPADLSELVRQVIERFQPQADRQAVRLELSKPGKTPLVSVDAIRVEQILTNLLSNGLRYTPQGGTIWVNVQGKGAEVMVTVHDSGPGIPEESLPFVFERFYRADKARARAEGGSGLGLAIARQLAQAHGGELTAENAPQGGAVFTLSLPVARR
jgi:two-component system OmpR family sensor kinase/two-component system sensor histidine kinase BaeS